MNSPLGLAGSRNRRVVAPLEAAVQVRPSAELRMGSGRPVNVVVLALLLVGLADAGRAAESKGRPSQNSNVNSSAPAVPSSTFTAPEPVFVKSLFVIPTKPGEGKDPFFPKSTRLFGEVSPKVPPGPSKATPAAVLDLRLKGISGLPGQRLAIINNRTVAAGEETDVSTGTGPVRIRCLDIKAESALVQIGAEQRELRLRAGL